MGLFPILLYAAREVLIGTSNFSFFFSNENQIWRLQQQIRCQLYKQQCHHHQQHGSDELRPTA